MASSFIVIKVKYGETLHRFRASISEKKLVLDIVKLREKIRGFFGFGSGIEFTLTYVDEDGDAIILACDDDLHDVVLQSLNPLRITVKLDNGNILGGSSGTFATSRVPQNRFPCQNSNTGFLHTLNSSSLPQSQSQTINASVSQTLNLSSPVQPPSQTTNPSASQTLNSSSLVSNRLQSSRTKVLQTLKSPSDQMNTGVLHSLNSSSLPQPQSQTINASVSETLNLSSPVQPQTQPIYAPVSQNLNSSSLLPNRLQSLRSWVPPTLESSSDQMNTGATSSASGVAWFVDYMDTYVNPTFTFMAGGGASNVGAKSKSSTVKDRKVQVNRKCESINSNKKEKQVQKAKEGVKFNFPHFEFKPFPDPVNATKGLKDTAPNKPPRSNLDSKFLCHVTVPDGTIMAPNTKFTKIWKMTNVGAMSWPQGSQLKWVWGDRLSSSSSVDIEIPADGLPVDKDLDIAVDFTAPGLPGRYISCWRMATPSGQKFGSQIWFKIQVGTSIKDLVSALDYMNLQPFLQDPEVVDQSRLIDSGNKINVSDSEAATVDSQSKDNEMTCPANDPSLIVDNGDVSSIMGSAAAPSSLPVGVGQPLDSASRQDISGDQEPSRVKDLEAVVGLKQTDLDNDVLKTNNCDVEKSVDDVFDVSDWDPMLDELQELGFADDETKSKLLLENDGTIKRAVMNLFN